MSKKPKKRFDWHRGQHYLDFSDHMCGEHEDVEFYRNEVANRKIRKLEKDNLRLKILARDMYKILSALDVDYCGPCPQDNRLYPCPRYTIYGGDCKFETAMRELGIEV